MRHVPSVILLALLPAVAIAVAEGREQVKEWKEFPGGWQLASREGVMRSTLDRETPTRMHERIADLRPFFEKHFGTNLRKGWSFTVLSDFDEYNRYAREVTKGQQNVQGQCLKDRKEIVVCQSKRYGWHSTLSHEYAHAYYDCSGPIWLREGIASLVEVAERRGKNMVIPVNAPRLRGLRLYQKKGHYLSIQHLLAGRKEPDGYGYSYEHGWSVHYFLYKLDPKRYRIFLRNVRTKTKQDLSGEVEKHFKADLETLDERWKEFVKELK